MNMSTETELFEKLQKVLRRADAKQGGTVNEVAIASAKAQELLQAYNLEHHTNITLAEVGGAEKQDPLKEYTQSQGDLGGVKGWRKYLINVIAGHMFCKVLTSKRGFWLIGKQVNINVVSLLYQQICTELKKEAADAYYSKKIIANGRWLDSFYTGAIDEIDKRMQEQKLKFQQDHAGKALIVLVDQELLEVTRIMFPHVKAICLNVKREDSAYYVGREAGRKVAIDPLLQ